jgi:hypothetical protein
MLSLIIGRIQRFEQRHGKRPQLVYLNDKHIAALHKECPALLEYAESGKLGFIITRCSEYENPHPRVAWTPQLLLTPVPGALTRQSEAKIYLFPEFSKTNTGGIQGKATAV